MKGLILLLLFSYLSHFSLGQNNITFRANLNYTQKLSALWGYTSPDSTEYALVGTNTGLSIVNISNPDAPNEVAFINGPVGIWREIKVYNDFAYITNEVDSGLQIVDLRFLPDSVSSIFWTGDTALLTAHTLFIDENGILYLNGFNNVNKTRGFDNRGFLMADLNTNPLNPQILGIYDLNYVHDCFVRNDTAWAAEISAGMFSVIDVSDKLNPVLMSNMSTPANFTHNTALSDNGKYLFTTDEKPFAPIAAYEVSDISNPILLDKVSSTFNSGVVQHNVRVLNEFLVAAVYKDGVIIVDASDPENLIKTGYFDTSPFLSEEGFAGAWDVYPFFPSGTIIVSDVEEGLFVLSPSYKKAAYLEGNIYNLTSGFPADNARIEILGNDWFDFSDLNGNYKTGIAQSGTYNIRIFKAGCQTKIIAGIVLQNDSLTILNDTLDCSFPTSVKEFEEKNKILTLPTVFQQETLIKYQLQSDALEQAQILITDLQGKLIAQFPIQDQNGIIQLGNDWALGTYLVSFSNKSIHKTLKIIKTN